MTYQEIKTYLKSHKSGQLHSVTIQSSKGNRPNQKIGYFADSSIYAEEDNTWIFDEAETPTKTEQSSLVGEDIIVIEPTEFQFNPQ